VAVGDYQIKVSQDARQAIIVGKTVDFGGETAKTREIKETEAGVISINGQEGEVKEKDTVEEVFEKIRNACDIVDVTLAAVSDTDNVITSNDIKNNPKLAGYTSAEFATNTSLVFITEGYGSNEELEITCSNPQLASLLGLSDSKINVKGVDAKVSIVT